MLKYIGLLCGVLMVVSACAKPNAAEEDPSDSLKQALSNYTNVCADVAFAPTIGKLGEADNFKSEGKTSDAIRAAKEAVELFKIDEPKYNALNNANEVQVARISEIAARRDTLDTEMSSIEYRALLVKSPAANNPTLDMVGKWRIAVKEVNEHLANARAAYEICDPQKAKEELDAASMILDQMEQMAANNKSNETVIVETTTVEVQGKVYTVQRGDCLWNIAGREYSNPFMWPIIYWTNKSQINDPDLIYPGQNFNIIYDFSEQDQIQAVDFSKNRGPWSLYDNK